MNINRVIAARTPATQLDTTKTIAGQLNVTVEATAPFDASLTVHVTAVEVPDDPDSVGAAVYPREQVLQCPDSKAKQVTQPMGHSLSTACTSTENTEGTIVELFDRTVLRTKAFAAAT